MNLWHAIVCGSAAFVTLGITAVIAWPAGREQTERGR